MKWLGSLSAFLVASCVALAQEPLPTVPDAPAPTPFDLHSKLVETNSTDLFPCYPGNGRHENFLTGNTNFPCFIGFISNPLQNIDPRAVTEFWPIFGSSWVTSPSAFLPDGNYQLYGAGLYLALSDRLCVGLNQGGYAAVDFSRRGLFGERGGEREGWLNFGGFMQYTVIEDVPNQFLLTAGLRWEAPTGSQAVFQGRGPAHLAPYLTIGKEIGQFHLLATTGYEFPVGSGRVETDFFYANFHLDRQFFGWLYPLVEVNWTFLRSDVDITLPSRGGFIDFGNFTSTGDIVTLAVGANAVLVRNKLELGAVYLTPLHTERNFDFNGLIVKMVYRY